MNSSTNFSNEPTHLFLQSEFGKSIIGRLLSSTKSINVSRLRHMSTSVNEFVNHRNSSTMNIWLSNDGRLLWRFGLPVGKSRCIIVRIEIEVGRVSTGKQWPQGKGAQKRNRLHSTAENVAIRKISLVKSVRRETETFHRRKRTLTCKVIIRARGHR